MKHGKMTACSSHEGLTDIQIIKLSNETLIRPNICTVAKMMLLHKYATKAILYHRKIRIKTLTNPVTLPEIFF